MEDHKLNKYLDEIGGQALLTAEEEQQLSERIHAGDQAAQNCLVEKNLRYVVAIARQYQGKGLSMEDLVSEGNMGLMKAAAKFDASRGKRFVNYAARHIREQIEKALKKESAEQRVETRRDGRMRSVDEPLGSKTGVNLLSVLIDGASPMADEGMNQTSLASAVEYALQSLGEREHTVINAYFGVDGTHMTMSEIAEMMDLKRERVRQIRDRAIRRMKKQYKRRLEELRG